MSHARAVLIDLARARTIVDRALGHARANDFPPMTVTMLDTAGALGLRPAKTDPACCVGVSRGPRHAAPSTWASAAEAWQPERRPTPRSSTQWSPSLMATLVPAAGGVLARGDDNNVFGAVRVLARRRRSLRNPRHRRRGAVR
jgi:uncharacterized protein GlcG (DUF336 family)